MGYPCYDYQLGCYLESYSDRVRAEKRLGVEALMQGEVVKAKTPEKIDIKRMIWENMQKIKYNPRLLYEAKIAAKKEKYERMLTDYEKGIYTVSSDPRG